MTANEHSTPSFSESELATEVWRPVPGYGGMYEASSLGRVARVLGGGGRRVRKPTLSTTGYLRLNLPDPSGAVRSRKAHAVVAETFLGPRPTGFHVNHLDLNKTNNRVLNLEWVTPRENVLHYIRNGSVIRPARKRGVPPSNAKLTRDLVASMLLDRMAGASLRELSVKYGVSVPSASSACSGRTWGGVRGSLGPGDPVRLGHHGAGYRTSEFTPGTAKLTPAAVREIRGAHALGRKQVDLAAMYSVSPDAIMHICNRRTWRWVV